MALIRLGGGITDMRGSIGGVTFARNMGGSYARARMKPVNPRAALQNERRAVLAQLTKAWSDVLDDDQRLDWRAYAAGTTWTNRLGDVIQITAIAAFLRLNSLLLLMGEELREDAPTAMGHAGNPTFLFDAESDVSNIEVAEPVPPFLKTEPAHFIAIFQALPVEAGRLAGRRGHRYIGEVHGATAPGTTFPVDIAAAYTMAVDQVITLEHVFIDEHFRVGARVEATTIASPSS